MKWLWPLNWYFRIRELEEQLARERAMNLKLEMSLRAANLHTISLTSAYSAAVASIASMYAQR